MGCGLMTDRCTPELLAEYAAGQLGAAQAARLQRHLAGCPACRARLAEYRDLSARLSLALGAPGPAIDSTGSWWRTIQKRRQRPWHATWAPALLALALLVAAMVTPPSARAFTPPAATYASAAITTPLAPSPVAAGPEHSTQPVELTPATPADTLEPITQPPPPAPGR